jgi:peptidoglycan-N-acetylglucosamine deacetylase
MTRFRASAAAIVWSSWAFLLLGLAGGSADDLARRKPPACPPDALGTARTLEIGAPGGLTLGLKSYPQTLDLADHEIVLTFDDGPLPATTPAVLDALAQQCVKATFFLIGRNAEAAPELVKRELAEGHTVGHHTFSHPGATLRGLADTAARQDIEKGFEADDKAAYGTTGTAPKVPFFRFPGFADTPELVAWLGQRNVAIFGADLWASDWITMSPEAELNLVLSRLEAEKRGILLLHDIRRQTVIMLPELLIELKRRGFKIVHLVPGPERPALRKAPTSWISETEAVIRRFLPKFAVRDPPRDFTQPASPVDNNPPNGVVDDHKDE